MWLEEKKSLYGLLEFVVRRVRKTHNGKPAGGHRTVSHPVSGWAHFRDGVGTARGMACGAIHHRLLVMHMRPPMYVERQVACDNSTAKS